VILLALLLEREIDHTVQNNTQKVPVVVEWVVRILLITVSFRYLNLLLVEPCFTRRL